MSLTQHILIIGSLKNLQTLQEPLWPEIIKDLEHPMRHKMELLNAVTTRFSTVASTIRSSIYKQGERNIIQNIINANGYEGVIEIYKIRKCQDESN